ncbi:MAG: hypothetical protein IPN92_10325 [Chromatiaceae bacterium]|nr:hypothetical protein [Chromatiaceae bacterium]
MIQATQAKVWDKLEALCKWPDTRGNLDTLRHGFKGFGKTMRSSGALHNRSAAVVTAAVIGRIPLKEASA